MAYIPLPKSVIELTLRGMGSSIFPSQVMKAYVEIKPVSNRIYNEQRPIGPHWMYSKNETDLLCSANLRCRGQLL